MKSTIHLVFTVPQGATLFRRGIDKFIRLAHLTPLHRFGYDSLIPWQHPIRSVHAITYNLLHTFKDKGYPVRLYSLYEHGVARLALNDIFVGLPLPKGGMGWTRPDTDERSSVTSRTIREYPHNKNFLIMPYSHDPQYVMWTKDLVSQNAKQGGGAVFIGGNIWKRNWSASPYADIPGLRKTHVEMGIDATDYPIVKTRFNAKGRRKFLYIGHTAWYKNTAELENIARAIPGFEGLHIGEGEVRGWKNRKFASLTPTFMKGIAEEYDIFVNTSTGDPQATTILEQMCFGFVVACTAETGYDYESLVRLDPHDTALNVEKLQELQFSDETDLLERTRINRQIAEKDHTWGRFCTSVTDFMHV